MWNPAFDVTPHDLITGGIVTEWGVFAPAELRQALAERGGAGVSKGLRLGENCFRLVLSRHAVRFAVQLYPGVPRAVREPGSAAATWPRAGPRQRPSGPGGRRRGGPRPGGRGGRGREVRGARDRGAVRGAEGFGGGRGVKGGGSASRPPADTSPPPRPDHRPQKAPCDPAAEAEEGEAGEGSGAGGGGGRVVPPLL